MTFPDDDQDYESGNHCHLVGHEYLVTKSGRECRKCGRMEKKIKGVSYEPLPDRWMWIGIVHFLIALVVGLIVSYTIYNLCTYLFS